MHTLARVVIQIFLKSQVLLLEYIVVVCILCILLVVLEYELVCMHKHYFLLFIPNIHEIVL